MEEMEEMGRLTTTSKRKNKMSNVYEKMIEVLKLKENIVAMIKMEIATKDIDEDELFSKDKQEKFINEVVNISKDIYKKYFTESEIEQLIKFYETEVDKKYFTESEIEQLIKVH